MTVKVLDMVVVITGSSRGIGSELAKAFAKEQAKIVVNYLNSEKEACDLYKEIVLLNQDCILVKADVTKTNDVKYLYDKVMGRFGKVDILINNAGVCDDNSIQNMSKKQWKRAIDVNLTGVFLCSKIFSKSMIKQRYGKIINISSIKGQEGCEEQVNYSASKAGLFGLTKAMAKDLGKYNISVNAICPGFVCTDLNKCNTMKKKVAEGRSLFNINYSLEDLIGFTIYLSSNRVHGISGRIFNLDSRL